MDDGLTGHLCFGSLVVDRLAGQGVDSDLGDGHRGIFQLAVEPQDLSTLTGVLHHLDADKKNRHERVSGFKFKKMGLDQRISAAFLPKLCKSGGRTRQILCVCPNGAFRRFIIQVGMCV